MFKTKKITQIKSIQILDSRGNPTLQTTVWAGDECASASVPSGASTGAHEAVELRDGDKKVFGGKSVFKAVEHVEKQIARALVGRRVVDQIAIDEAMIALDGTENKGKLGANAILSVSLAMARLGARMEGLELFAYVANIFGNSKIDMKVTPLFNIINGGAHANSGLNVQEMMVIPQTGSFSDKLEHGVAIYHALKKVIAQEGGSTGVGDEGGFAPKYTSHAHALDSLVAAIKNAGFKGKQIALGMDVASSEFYNAKEKQYTLALEDKKLNIKELVALYQEWQKKYPLVLIEDGMAEDDFKGWEHLTEKMSKKTTLVGDDFFVTNPKRIKRGIDLGLANAVLIKLNQIGTLTETLEAIGMAQDAGYKVIISHRSGETNDSFISDLAVAVNADYIKTGAPARGERVAKYNRLLEIERLFSR